MAAAGRFGLGLVRSHVDVFINESNNNCVCANLYQFLDIQLYPLKPPFDRPRNVLTSLWGATCNPIDRMEERTLMFDVSVDEWLFMDNMGAYSLIGVTGFNGFGFPFVKYITTADKRPSVQRIVDSMVMRGGYGQVEEAIMARHPSGRITVADAGGEKTA
ncbi:ornithine decarboxylase, putative [Ixodes scapularis]|uniref:Ornithine decarboxylase, putative n=1 Tax=Ixodes scapularis TaxID=6945 RepID=B7PKH6_IXOSC|nr:ornithine decarboxylase, putative [Ixodes scapularis]|eukprot:XP_002400274.1 ornithine decarboxylase, putative [Ixodes scapularis]